MNYFAPKTAAERYAQGRPDVHRHSIDQISRYLQLEGKLDKALDIACGTGLSTRALVAIAKTVYGTDISPEMMQYAPSKDIIHYTLAPAEQQPFPDRSFDLITVASGVHWFDVDRFLAEAHRLLKNNRWLVLYENYFDPVLQNDARFHDWFSAYTQQFPAPPRNKYTFNDENLQPKRLRFLTELRSTYIVPLTRQQFALYLTTQSSVIAKVENGETSYDAMEKWLNDELSPFFDDTTSRPMTYGNWIKFIQKID